MRDRRHEGISGNYLPKTEVAYGFLKIDLQIIWAAEQRVTRKRYGPQLAGRESNWPW
jgi:hypothetical protein